MNTPSLPRGQRGSFQADATRSCTLPSAYYRDPGIYQRELEQIFYRSWCYLGHASEIPQPGDYRVDRIADQCVFLLRDDDETVRAFYNVCQHRGHELLSGQGNCRRRIVCPYHAWSYSLDGQLIAAPHSDRLPDFDPAEFGLREIALANCRGLLFANLDPGAGSFAAAYAGLEQIFDDHLPKLETFAPAHQFDYNIAANWKVVVDNFSEGYHIPVAHKRLSQVLDSAGGTETVIKPHFAFFKSRCKSGYAGMELEPGLPYLSWTLWPNTCMLSQPGCDNLIVLRMAPAGPTRCLERVDILSPRGQTGTKLEAVRALFTDHFNPEDIAIVESVQRGLQSLGYDQGRYVADDSDSWYSESGLHRFHLQVIQALEGQ